MEWRGPRMTKGAASVVLLARQVSLCREQFFGVSAGWQWVLRPQPSALADGWDPSGGHTSLTPHGQVSCLLQSIPTAPQPGSGGVQIHHPTGTQNLRWVPPSRPALSLLLLLFICFLCPLEKTYWEPSVSQVSCQTLDGQWSLSKGSKRVPLLEFSS